MNESTVLYSKEGFTFLKNDVNNYSLTFSVENNYIILPKIIDFQLIKLIYDLNTDIYEKTNLQLINDNEAIITMLMKHLFEDLGLPQRFSHVNCKRTILENQIIIESQTIKGDRPSEMPHDAELMPIQNMICRCNIVTQHKVNFSCNIQFVNTMRVPAVAEKLFGLILYKIFNRVKQFIENIRV